MFQRGTLCRSETVASTVVVLAILIGLIAFLAFLKKKGKSFTFRVFTALGLGVVFGAGIQIVLGLVPMRPRLRSIG